MKKLVILIMMIIVSFQFIQAGSVGITPVHFKEFFEPGLIKTYTFHSFSSTSEEGVYLYIEGDLAEYANISETHLPGGGYFTVTISLPESIDKPGTHKIFVGAAEAKKINNTDIGGVAAIRARIDILVPFPGEYIESDFSISNINEGEKAPYKLEIQSLGTKATSISSNIEVYEANNSKPLISQIISREKEIMPKEIIDFAGTIETENLPAGEYTVFTKVKWGKDKMHTYNDTLRVGKFLIEIIDYDYQFKQGEINLFNIEIENKWNTKIEEVFAMVWITDHGIEVGNFKTVTINTTPWETRNITGYFDASNLEAKRYIATITLFYGESKTSKLVAIYIKEPPTKTYRTYIIIAIIITFMIVGVITYLIWKVNKLSHKNEKKKK